LRIVFDPEFDHGSWPGPLRGGRASAGEDWLRPSGLFGVLGAALATLPAADVPGLPDRLRPVQQALERRTPGVECLELLTPRAELGWLWQRTLDLLERRGTHITGRDPGTATAPAGSDLAGSRAGGVKLNGVGSLLLLRPVGPLLAAEEVAAWIACQ
jgi:hypothetical protein